MIEKFLTNIIHKMADIFNHYFLFFITFILIVIYIILKMFILKSKNNKYEISEWEKTQFKNTSLLTALDNKAVLMSGEQGLGKTTFMNKFAQFTSAKNSNIEFIRIQAWDYRGIDAWDIFLNKLSKSKSLTWISKRILNLFKIQFNLTNILGWKYNKIENLKKVSNKIKLKKDAEIFFIIDEIERCKVGKSLEIIEVFTILLGVT